MPLPDLESLDAGLDEACLSVLGDTIKYTPSATGTELTIKVYTDHRDGQRIFDSAAVIEQDMSIQLLASTVPAKPSSHDRITLPKIPGAKFKPVNVRRDESGNYWEFELKAVNA